jgi:transposase
MLDRNARFSNIRLRYIDLVFVVGAAAIIVAGGLYHVEPLPLAFGVVVAGSMVAFVWLRHSTPSQSLRGKAVKAIFPVGLLCGVTAVAGIVWCFKRGWHWWALLLVFPGWMTAFCWRFGRQAARLAQEQQPHTDQADQNRNANPWKLSWLTPAKRCSRPTQSTMR